MAAVVEEICGDEGELGKEREGEAEMKEKGEVG